jgi:hypothetical protein
MKEEEEMARWGKNSGNFSGIIFFLITLMRQGAFIEKERISRG